MRNEGNTRNTGAAALQIRLLGAPQITHYGAPVTALTSAKAQGLLYYLAVTGRMHTRAALAGLLWGDVPEAAARGNLRKALQQLRRHLGDYLTIERDVVALAEDADLWVDAVEFEACLSDASATGDTGMLQRAVDLYQGDFLDGFYVRNAPAFEDWCLSEQTRLRESMLNGLQALADQTASHGDLASAIALARRFLALEPWREEAHRRLMIWLARSGQRAAALAQYETCRQTLEEELGVEPADETTGLYERIRDGELDDLLPSRVSVRPAPFPVLRLPAFLESEAEPVEADVFVGRMRELSQLDGFLEQALSGRGQVAFVVGEAGQGKTSLLREFARRAQDAQPELIVASGTCDVYTGLGDPYLPFRDVMTILTGGIEAAWITGTLARDHALRLWSIWPHAIQALVDHGPNLIDTLVPGGPLENRTRLYLPNGGAWLERLQELRACTLEAGSGPGPDQNHIFEEYGAVLKALADQRPLLLVLDDLHWADLSSIGLLSHLGRRIAADSVLIVGAYRPEDVAQGREGRQHPLAGVLSEFKRHAGDIWVDLDQTGRIEGRAFVDGFLDTQPNRLGEDFRRKLTRRTGGHPLFTVELVRDMEERGDLRKEDGGEWIVAPDLDWDVLPARVEGVIEKRFDRLEGDLRDALTVASVEGEEFTAEVVAQVRGVDQQSLVRLLSDELDRRHRLVAAQGVHRRGAEGQRLSRYRFRHNLFQRYLYLSLDEVELAYLHEAVGNGLETLYQEQTEEIAVRLARHFQIAGLPEKAIYYLQQAGDAAARVYANDEAIAHYSRGLELAEETDIGSEMLAPLFVSLGRVLELNSSFEQALETYKDMEAVARQRGDRRMELAALMARVTIQAMPTRAQDLAQAQDLGERALALARELEDQASESGILWSLSLANQWAGRWQQAIDCGERSLALARELDLREQMAQTLNDLGSLCYLYTSHVDKSIASLREASALWREFGNLPMLADSLSSLAVAHVYAGEYDRAIALSEEAFQISRSINNPWGRSYSRWKVGFAFWDRGELGRAVSVMEECVRLGEVADFVPSQTHTRAELAAVYGDLGIVARGLETGLVALSVGETRQHRVDRAEVLGVLAHLHLLDGDLTAAEARIEEGKNASHRGSWPVFTISVAIAEGELALRKGEYERALTVTDDLLVRLRQFGMRVHVPYALYLQGQAYLGLDRDETAREHFSEAHAQAKAIGSRRTLWRILHALSQVEDDATEAERLRQEARQVIEYIADQIDQPDLRASFLNLPDVQAVQSD